MFVLFDDELTFQPDIKISSVRYFPFSAQNLSKQSTSTLISFLTLSLTQWPYTSSIEAKDNLENGTNFCKVPFKRTEWTVSWSRSSPGQLFSSCFYMFYVTLNKKATNICEQ